MLRFCSSRVKGRGCVGEYGSWGCKQCLGLVAVSLPRWPSVVLGEQLCSGCVLGTGMFLLCWQPEKQAEVVCDVLGPPRKVGICFLRNQWLMTPWQMLPRELKGARSACYHHGSLYCSVMRSFYLACCTLKYKLKYVVSFKTISKTDERMSGCTGC